MAATDVDTYLFQSTLPVWGATTALPSSTPTVRDFNPRSPCGERRCTKTVGITPTIFQSTLPVWGATASNRLFKCHVCISIHAPRVGSDSIQPLSGLHTTYFNPRSPCGERHAAPCRTFHSQLFQSTLPVWGATRYKAFHTRPRLYFNPRSPCGERRYRSTNPVRRCNFNPRSPCGERPQYILLFRTKNNIL